MNLLDNSGAEAATTPPTTSGSVVRTTFTANSGSYSWALTGSLSEIGGSVSANIEWTVTGLTVGTAYEAECYVNGSLAVDGAPVTLFVDKGDGAYVYANLFRYWQAPQSWARMDGGSFVAVGTTARFRVRASSPPTNGTSTWFVDDCRLAEDGDVAIRLSERAVDNVVSLLQTNLATELTAIDTERGDGITTPAPPTANYYKRPKLEIAGGTCHVEVFDGSFEFLNAYSDQDSQRAASIYPLIVRVTCFRRSGESADAMTLIRRRLAAGVVNTLLTNTTYTDAEIQRVLVTGVDHDADYSEDGTINKVQVTLGITVQQEESYS